MKFIYIMLLSLLLVACKTKTLKQSAEFGEKVALSSYAMMFVGELRSMVPLKNITCSYIPNQEFMRKYGLGLDVNGECIVDAVITMKDSTDLTNLKIRGVNINLLYKNKYHCRLPLCKLYELLNNPEVVYFDLSKPVFKL